MMRSFFAASALALLVLPAPASAQWTVTVPADDQVGAAVNLTAVNNMARRGYDAGATPVPPSITNTLAMMEQQMIDDWNSGRVGRHLTGVNAGWAAVMFGVGIAQGVRWGDGNRVECDGVTYDECGGGYGGGGATGSWGELAERADQACDFPFRLDVDGNLIIPSVPLAPGAAVTQGPGKIMYWRSCNDWKSPCSINVTVDYVTQSDRADSVELWALHNINKGRGSDPRSWIGIWRIAGGAGGQYDGRSQAYYLDGVKQNAATELWTPSTHGFYNAQVYPQQQDCPNTTVTGGTFHFYSYGSNNDKYTGCLWYSPNPALSPSGYYYPAETTMPKQHSGMFPRSLPDHIAACKINPELLRQLTDKIWHRASQRPGYNGVPYSPVTAEDVKVDRHPTFNDLWNGNQPKITGTDTPTPQAPDAPPSPAPSPGLDLGPDPGIGAPTLEEPNTGIMDPIFDWLPDLPSITLGDHSSNCPTFALNLTEFGGPEWQWLMDDQCDIFEENRAAISALMVALWGMAAALIILRA